MSQVQTGVPVLSSHVAFGSHVTSAHVVGITAVSGIPVSAIPVSLIPVSPIPESPIPVSVTLVSGGTGVGGMRGSLQALTAKTRARTMKRR